MSEPENGVTAAKWYYDVQNPPKKGIELNFYRK